MSTHAEVRHVTVEEQVTRCDRCRKVLGELENSDDGWAIPPTVFVRVMRRETAHWGWEFCDACWPAAKDRIQWAVDILVSEGRP